MSLIGSVAKTIGELEELSLEEQQILELAAVLHDIGIKISEQKYGSSAGTYQAVDRNDFQILVEADFLVNIDKDNMSKEVVRSVQQKYFKTVTGKQFIEQIFLKK